MSENEVKDNFGAILARERKKENKSLKDLAEILGRNQEGKYNITASYLNRLEKGEKENPSFWMVCLMIDRLNLNVREVFKSFGFENVLPPAIDVKTTNIKEIIRLSDIKAPLSLNEGESVEGFLTQEEKESLLSIIKESFNYSVCDAEDELYYASHVVGSLEYFKHERQKYFDQSFEVLGEQYKLKFSRSIKILLDKIGIEDEQILDIVQKFNDKLLNKKGKFMLRDAELGIIISFSKAENVLTILDVTNEIEEV